jgi:ribonucleoside-diphosphate reductase alpha chain
MTNLNRLTKKQLVALLEAGPQRKTLPDTRPSINHKFKIDSATGVHTGYITVGFYDDEKTKPGEVFIKLGKQGSTLNGLLDTIGILLSYGLQFGMPLGDVCHKLQGMTFEPEGETKNPELEHCSSIIDYVFTWLELEFGPFEQEAPTSRLVTD